MGAISAAAPAWDFPRSPAATRCLVDIGRGHGVSGESLLTGTGLTLDVLGQRSLLVRADQELTVARNLIAHLGDQPGLGVQAGERYDFGNLGVFGFAMLSSATVGEALDLAMRFPALSSVYVTMTLEFVDDTAILYLDDREIPLEVRDFMVERDLGALLRLTALSAGAVLNASGSIRIETRLNQERTAALAAQSPEFELTGSQPANRVVFDRTLLEQPMPTADATTARFCLRVCEETMAHRRDGRSLATHVRSRLAADPAGLPDIEGIAAELGLSERTLRRRLARERTSFRILIDERRKELATELVSTTMLTVEQVGRRVGYADGASFSRAFTRWHGQTPGLYRLQHS